VPADNHPVVAPIYQSVKFEFETVDEALASFRGERDGFFYQRDSNPTLRQLEQTLAQMQGRDDCVVCASGVGAIANVLFSLTQAGDHIICFIEGYGPTRRLITRTLKKFGVAHTLLSIEDLVALERVLETTPTRLLIFESPTNPINKIADLATIARLAREYGALTLMDNTLAGMHQHGAYEIDIYLHSLTKFAAGHGDVMGGAAIANQALIDKLRPDFTLFGGTLDPHAAFMIQRGLKTYFVRYRQQCISAQLIAEFLAGRPEVEQVFYPGLASSAGHALARDQMTEFGSVVSFDLKAGAAAGRKLADELKLFATAASLGATDSLILPPQMLGARDLTEEQRRISGIGPGTVRLSIGLEDTADLIADLQQALQSN
jgi:cystathionine beta-lyase/cystathionine gamma-synthase